MLDGFEQISFFAVFQIERQDCSAAATFGSVLAFSLFCEESRDGNQQKSPEPTSLSIGKSNVVLLEQRSEEFLRQVLRVGGRGPPSADERIHRVPVSLAQSRQGRFSLCRLWRAGCDNDAPAGRGKFALTRERIWRGCRRGHVALIVIRTIARISRDFPGCDRLSQGKVRFFSPVYRSQEGLR